MAQSKTVLTQQELEAAMPKRRGRSKKASDKVKYTSVSLPFEVWERLALEHNKSFIVAQALKAYFKMPMAGSGTADAPIDLGGNPEHDFVELYSSQQYPNVRFFGKLLAFVYSTRDNFSRSYDGSRDCWREMRLYALEDKFVLAIKYGESRQDWEGSLDMYAWHVLESREALEEFLQGFDDPSGRDTYKLSKRNGYRTDGWLERELLAEAFDS
jgi:hypothetical protein